MLLLDENLPLKIKDILEQNGYKCETVFTLGWSGLKNGQLVSKAIEKGYSAILTKDKLFAESAAKSLSKFPNFAVIRITLLQKTLKEYLNNFSLLLKEKPLELILGTLTEWPYSLTEI